MSEAEPPNVAAAPGPSVEGIDENAGLGDYPIDAVLIRSEQRTVHDVLRRIGQGGYVMDPEFQREFLWDEERQSRLIESVLMRIPLPVIYLAENEDGKLVVVDGLQRLSTFRSFLAGGFKLKLSNPELKGKCFGDLPPKMQNRIEDTQLVVYIIDSKVPERARLDIFDRVNSGVPLTRQQMRNSLYQGPATTLLRDLARSEPFQFATGGGLDSKSMRDREAINRFCAFRILGLDAYRGGMDDYLAEALRRVNGMPEAEVGLLRYAFTLSMANNLVVFEEHAFRKHQRGARRRSVINMSLFDVESVGLARYALERVSDRVEPLRDGFYKLIEDPEFTLAITYGTSDSARVRTRFEKFDKLLAEVLGAP